MAEQKRHCPVCHRKVGRTLHGMIEGHWDTAGSTCEGDVLPYRCAKALSRRKLVAA